MRVPGKPQSETSVFDTKPASSLPLPRGPVLDWSNFKIVDVPSIPTVENTAHIAFTTSGRAAIYQALLQLRLPSASTVLVPSYHCPTMVAPILLANLSVAYFGIRADGLPKLDTIDATVAKNCKAMLVSHYFGLAHSLAEVRQWCDERGIALIEDCAHCYFGNAGEKPVGAWGDYSTASLSKFLPVPEGGLLASAHRPIPNLRLVPPSFKAQLKGAIDVFELSSRHQRFAGLSNVLAFIFNLKNSRLQQRKPADMVAMNAIQTTRLDEAQGMMRDCDMTRIEQAPLWATMILKALLPRGRIIARRQQNFNFYARYFEDVQGARPLFHKTNGMASQVAPYVFPLWVDDADRVYPALRAMELPVFRWDRIWPGTPQMDGDVGPLWSCHVLQLLCHQDLGEADIERTSRAILGLLSNKF